MKKIMLVLISVVILFSACEKQTDNSVEESIQTQIDPTEEFGGITFGMTEDEVINILGKKPYKTYGPDDIDSDYNYIMYRNKEHFNVLADHITYCFTRKDGALRRIIYDFSRDESEQEQFMNSYEVIKEDLIRRYPEEICTYFLNDETDLTIYTENRSIFLHAGDSLIRIFVDEYLPGIYDTRSETEEGTEPAEEAIQTQVNPTEEFGGITFGMTKEEVITVIGREPDYDYEPNIEYKNHIFWGVISHDTKYNFDENGNLDSISAFYMYLDESGEEQAIIDLEHIKGELSKYYPENTLTRIDEEDNILFLFTENRMICLETHDNSFSVFITPIDIE